MRVRGNLHLLLLFVLLGSGIAAAQAKPANTASANIDLNVVVAPKKGPPVGDLQQSDFTVLDNKVPQRLTSFRVLGPRDPVHVTLVIDAVNVPYTSIAYQRSQIEKFLRSNGGQLPQPTQLAVFTDAGIQVQGGFTTDGNELNTTLNQQAIGLREIRRSSQYEGVDRLDLSLTALRSLAEHEAAQPGRKMIVWISPGWPLLSGPGIELDAKQQNHIYETVVQLSRGLRNAQIVLYNVNPLGAGEGVLRSFYYQDYLKPVTKPGQAQLADLSLQVLAAQTGGLVLLGSNDLPGELAQCMADTRASYQLSFVPGAADERSPFHTIEVQVNRPGLIARTRSGYYTQP